LNKNYIIISALLIALLIIVFITTMSGIHSDAPNYEADKIKKIAYDYLSDDIKEKIVTSIEDYHTIGEDAQNAENIWLYASCEEIKLKDVGLNFWIDEDTKEKYDTFKNRNKIVLVVKWDTTDNMLETIGLYVDPVDLEVIGYVVTY